MPVRHSVIHKIDKKPDGSPAVLFLDATEQVESQARDDLMSQLNESYNATAGKDGVSSTHSPALSRLAAGSESTWPAISTSWNSAPAPSST